MINRFIRPKLPIIQPRMNEISEYYRITQTYYPQYLEEIKGFASGAHIDSRALFAIMCTEFWYGCTDIVVPHTHASHGRTILVHTNDETADKQPYTLIFRIKAPDEPELLLITTAGIIIDAAINAQGVCYTGNYLASNENALAGVPRSIFYRALIGSHSLDHVLWMTQHIPRVSSENYVITTKKTQLNIECSAKQCISTRVEDIYVHTNHFLAPSLDQYYRSWDGINNSKTRLVRVNKLLSDLGKKNQLTLEHLMSLIKDHGGHNVGSAICRHTIQSTTQFSLIMEFETNRIIVGIGNPCDNNFVEIDHSFIQESHRD
jgi:predicted choloylglycine hydrolase